MPKKYYLVLDTETVTDARIPYDVGCIIVDRCGNMCARYNALASEIMEFITTRKILEKDSFAKHKAAFYLNNIDTPIKHFAEIRFDIWDLLDKYNPVVVAYNAAFDVKVLNDYSKIMCNSKFFTEDVEVWDLWNMALNTVCDSSNYVRWCIDNGFVTEKGNISCSAEAVYSYLVGNGEFKEKHTALADCEIEAQILQAVFKRKKQLCTEYCSPVFRQKVWKKRLKGVIQGAQ